MLALALMEFMNKTQLPELDSRVYLLPGDGGCGHPRTASHHEMQAFHFHFSKLILPSIVMIRMWM